MSVETARIADDRASGGRTGGIGFGGRLSAEMPCSLGALSRARVTNESLRTSFVARRLNERILRRRKLLA